MWEWKYVRNYQIICDEFTKSFYTQIHDNPTPSMSKTTFYVMEDICDWYHTKEQNYLWIYCGYEPCHIPQFEKHFMF